MSSLRRILLTRLVLSLACAAIFAAGSASAQLSPSSSPSGSSAVASGESSSLQYLAENGDGAGLPAAPSSAQYYGSPAPDRYEDHGVLSHLAFEAGGGFNAPTSASTPHISWGGNFSLGAGYRFNSRFSLMAEYQFIDDKLPGALIAETGASGGNAHIWSLTLDPVIDLFPKHNNDFYVTGGGGFYRKMTNFTDPSLVGYCDYYYYYCGTGVANVVVGHFSSNQGGWNIGGGYTHRIAPEHDNGRIKLYAEVRYLDVMNKAVNGISPNGLGTTTVGADTKLVPVTFGVRW
jgi:hypothetical protein